MISGDSGGATYDDEGEVVGMTTAASTGSNDVVGFAIPIAKVTRIAGDLENGTENARYDYGSPAFLGLGLGGSSSRVGVVYPGTPAARAGITAGDTITRVGATRCARPPSYATRSRRTPPATGAGLVDRPERHLAHRLGDPDGRTRGVTPRSPKWGLKFAPFGHRIDSRPPARLSRTVGVPTRTCPMSNLTIANIFLFLAILCMALSFSAGLFLYFIYSIAATALAGAVRYDQLPDKREKTSHR